MDDSVPRLVGLALAGVVVLMGLRGRLPQTRRGEVLYRVLMVAFLIAIAIAALALIRRGGGPVEPDPDSAMQITQLALPTNN